MRFVYDNCVGCAACIDACPYGVIRMVEPSGEASSVINIGGEEVPVDGKAIKCDLCAGLPFEACVYNCPTSAISRRAPEDLFRP